MAGHTKHVTVGTSGHIDHGKTSLVRALTGTETDRWEEEKRRGITIDLGFAELEVEPGLCVSFVDVPGHERFVKNMLAGAGGIDLVVLIIAADESVMPQTREHFQICRLLGVRHGLIALTKSDLVDEEILELVQLEVDEFVAGSFLEDAPVVAVSSSTGAGLNELRAALAAVAKTCETRRTDGFARLPVDRVFTMRGFGTVVTGTLASGRLRIGDQLEALPAGIQARVRNVEVHGRQAKTAEAGWRTAINLGGIPKESLERGASLVEPERFRATRQIDARIELLPTAKKLKHAAPVHLHLGTAETVGRTFILGARSRNAAVEPGTSAFVQLRLDNPVLALTHDRFILRQFSPLTTIAGGTVLRPDAPRHRRSEDWQPLLEALLADDRPQIMQRLAGERPYGIVGSDLAAMTGVPETEWLAAVASEPNLRVLRRAPLWVCMESQLEEAGSRYLAALESFHQANPLVGGASIGAMRNGTLPDAPDLFADFVTRRLLKAERIVIEGDRVRLSTHTIRLDQDEQNAHDRLVSAFADAGLQVPAVRDFLATLPIDRPRAQRILAALLRDGVLERISRDLVFHAEAVRALRDQLAPLRGQHITVGDFKDLANVSRKYAIPLLEHFDRQKVTIRDGDRRRVL